jgi:hypothetical protein
MAAITTKTLVSSSICVTVNVVTPKNGLGCDMVAKADLAMPLSSHQRSQTSQRIPWHYDCADNFGAARNAARAGRSERCPEVVAFGSPRIRRGTANAARNSLAGWSYCGLVPSMRAASVRVFATDLKPAQARSAGKHLADVSAFAVKRG